MDTALFDKTGGSEVVSTTEQTNRKLTKGDNCIVVLFMDLGRSWLVVISCSRRSTVLPIYGSVYAAAAGPVRTKTRPDARCIIRGKNIRTELLVTNTVKGFSPPEIKQF